jgi:hypothetical protein
MYFVLQYFLSTGLPYCVLLCLILIFPYLICIFIVLSILITLYVCFYDEFVVSNYE